MLAAMPNAIYLESGSLKGDSMYQHGGLKEMVDGEVLVPDVPGLGAVIKDSFIEEHSVS